MMNIVFFGTPAFAVPSLQLLLQEGFGPQLVVCQPDRKQGRGQRLQPCAVKQEALRAQLPLLQASSLKSPEALEALRAMAIDVGIVVAYGQLIPDELLALPRLDFINLHPSLLPRHRGPTPLQTALRLGEMESGVSIMRLVSRLDAGPVLHQSRCALEPDLSCGELHDRLALQGAQDLLHVLKHLAQHGSHLAVEQDENEATMTHKIEREQCHLAWDRSAEELHNWVRSLSPHPAAFSFWSGQTLKIRKLAVLPPRHSESWKKLAWKRFWQGESCTEALERLDAHTSQPAGFVWAELAETQNSSSCAWSGPVIACGQQQDLVLLELQLAGKQAQSGAVFLRGHRDLLGAQLQ